MILRTRQIACLLVLLSTLGLGTAASAEGRGFRGTPIEALLYRQAVKHGAANEGVAKLPGDDAKAPRLLDVSAAARVAITTAWAMPAAAEHASAISALQSVPRSL